MQQIMSRVTLYTKAYRIVCVAQGLPITSEGYSTTDLEQCKRVDVQTASPLYRYRKLVVRN